MEIIQEKPHQRLDFKCVSARVRGSWRYVLIQAGVPEKFLTSSHGPCPCCGGRDRFRWDDKNESGSFFCTNCGSGDGFKLVQLVRGCSPKESLNLVSNLLGVGGNLPDLRPQLHTREPRESEVQPDKRKKKLIDRVWHESVAISEGDPAWTYLTATRGLPLFTVPDTLRLHPTLGYWVEDAPSSYKLLGTYPAMVAAVVSADGDLVSVHRTFLTQDGKKAPVASPKKLMAPETRGCTMGAAIRLQDAGHLLAVTEGIETGLAVHLATGYPVWAGVTANGVASLVVPEGVKQVGIFGDNDSAGQDAALKLASRLCDQGLSVRIVLPPEQGTDWLDVYIREAV